VGYTSRSSEEVTVRNLKELNINDGGHPVARPAPSSHSLTMFAHEFGIQVPGLLQDLLAFSNGGHPELSVIDSDYGEFAINTFYHLDDYDQGDESMFHALRVWRRFIDQRFLPFGNSSTGDQFCVDLSVPTNPVYICRHADEFRMIPLSSSFTEFLNGLRSDPDLL
jgi:hypothetical protein